MDDSRCGRILAVACAAAGLGLVLGWILLRFPGAVLLLPCYGVLSGPMGPKLITALTIYVILLLTTAWALSARKKFAPYLFIAGGWLGLINTIVMHWPTQRVRNMIDFGVAAARRRGAIPDSSGVWELVRASVPGWLLFSLIALTVTLVITWLVLLVAGTRHLLRERTNYTK